MIFRHAFGMGLLQRIYPFKAIWVVSLHHTEALRLQVVEFWLKAKDYINFLQLGHCSPSVKLQAESKRRLSVGRWWKWPAQRGAWRLLGTTPTPEWCLAESGCEAGVSGRSHHAHSLWLFDHCPASADIFLDCIVFDWQHSKNSQCFHFF